MIPIYLDKTLDQAAPWDSMSLLLWQSPDSNCASPKSCVHALLCIWMYSHRFSLSIAERGLLTSPVVTMDLSIFLFSLLAFTSETLKLCYQAYLFRIVRASQ